jgi:hypothetical protein
MNTELERIEAEALQLSVEDRERLIEALIESLDQEQRDHANGTTTGEFGGFATAELQKYWLDEAERRMHLIRSGHMKTFPADEVMASVRARLKASREVR